MSAAAPGTLRPFERSLPPVTGLGMAALACAVVGGVIVAAQVGMDDPSLVVPAVFVAAGLLLEVVAVVALVSIRPFAWDRFRLVFSVGLAAYVLQSGIIAWAFVINDVPAGPMTILSLGLVVFATIVPVMLAFTVARFQAVDDTAGPT